MQEIVVGGVVDPAFDWDCVVWRFMSERPNLSHISLLT